MRDEQNTRQTVDELVRRHGATAAARMLGVAELSLLRLLAGQRVHAGTRALVAAGLERLAHAEHAP